MRVAAALSLLIGSKVRIIALILLEIYLLLQALNVQVPFYFKSIVDSMNVDFAVLGGTAWTVGGAMIVACMKSSVHLRKAVNCLRRWGDTDWCSCFSRIA